jgi:hypothetical protein
MLVSTLLVVSLRYQASNFTSSSILTGKAVKFSVPIGYHGQETPYIFANGATAGLNMTIASAIQQYIVSFVLNTLPSDADGIALPVYGPDAQLTNLTDHGILQTVDDAANDRCKWWQLGLYA